MVDKCIFNCANATRFFGFPIVCPKRMKLWAKLLGLDVNTICKKHRICEHHFDPKHIGKRYLLIDAIPLKRFSESTNEDDETSSLIEYNSDESHFETVYLESEKPTVKPQPSTIEDESHSDLKNIEPGRKSTNKNEYILDENPTLRKPVVTVFKNPPKRTYGQGNNSNGPAMKCPKLDITSTCYCRCHKGEDENLMLRRQIDEMKLMIAEQSHEISLLTSKNKISEHLLKGKVKKITELLNLETSLRRAIEGLNARISIITKRQIKAAPSASENSIIFARMICDKRKRYTKSEVVIANKLYAISGKCYYFLRDILKLNLPHPTTLLRNSQILSPSPNEHTMYEDYQGEPEEEIPIVFSPGPINEEPDDEEDIQIDIDME